MYSGHELTFWMVDDLSSDIFKSRGYKKEVFLNVYLFNELYNTS